jgi:hypothetical protein
MQDQPDINLFEWGMQNPTDFYKLSAKLIPAAIEHSGVDGKPIETKDMTDQTKEQLLARLAELRSKVNPKDES